jgi:hypothetical protein
LRRTVKTFRCVLTPPLMLPVGSAAAPAGIPRHRQMGLYQGAVDLYQAEADYAFAYTQVAFRAGVEGIYTEFS